jgi:hypothetical protein
MMQNEDSIKIKARRSDDGFGDDIDLRLVDIARRAFALPLTMQQVEVGQYIPPFVRLGKEQAQQLADALWEAGIRPIGASGSQGQLAAVQGHLNDMRAIVAKTIDVNLK